MYNRIRNPKTQRMVSIHGKLGRQILKNYISFLMEGPKQTQYGGNTDLESDKEPVVVFSTAAWCDPCNRFKLGEGGSDAASEIVKELRKKYIVYWFENNNQRETTLFNDDSWTVNNPPDKEMTSNIMTAHEGRGYPTIMMGNGNHWKYYNGERTIKGVVNWAEL